MKKNQLPRNQRVTAQNARKSPADAPPPAGSLNTVPTGRAWLFRLAALLLAPVVFLAGLELALRIGGYGYPAHFFLSQVVEGKKVLIENRKFGWRFFPPAAARTPQPMVIPAVKGEGTYRVFVLGESAAFGDPEPRFGFPRVLEVLLRARYPGTTFEVLNAAMTAINSNVILPNARDCARQQGDLWVVYMGNNEVVGPYGAGTVFGPQTPGLAFIRAGIALKATRIGQLLDDGRRRLSDRRKTPQTWGGMEMFVDHQVSADDPRMAIVYDHFQRNLNDIVRTGTEAGVKVLLSTVASNLKDCAPFASQHRRDLPPAQVAEWEKRYQAGVSAEGAGKNAEAIAAFGLAAQIDAGYADLQYRWGRCCAALSQFDDARPHFVLARDNDALRFRADTRINETIRQTAKDQQKEGVFLVDAAADLARKSPHGIPGEEFLLEHVHFNFNGNYLLARLVADQVAAALPASVIGGARTAAEWLSAERCAEQLALTDWNRYEIASVIRQRFEMPPFTRQLDHVERYQHAQKLAEQYRAGLTPAALSAAVRVHRDALARSPNDWELHENLGRLLQKLGDGPGAIEQWRSVLALVPHYQEAYYQLGSVLDQQGQSRQAITQFQKALALKPDSPEALNGLGLALANQGQFLEAIKLYEKALVLKPDFAGAHVNIGLALSRLGQTEEAKAHYEQAMRLKPDSPGAFINLGKILNSQGKISEAITNYAAALQINPEDAVAHFNLGNCYRKLGRMTEACEHYAEAVRINPGFAEAHCQLGFELARVGKEAEAMSHFADAVRLKPDYSEAHLNLGVALAKQQKLPEAIAHFQEALRLDPSYATAKKYLEAAQARLRKAP